MFKNFDICLPKKRGKNVKYDSKDTSIYTPDTSSRRLSEFNF